MSDWHDARRLDRVFETLGHPLRRRLLLAVRDRSAFHERGVSIHEVAPDEHADGFVAEMYHVHLPKLADSGYVDWDRRDEVIRCGPRFEDLSPVLEALSEWQSERSEAPQECGRGGG
ncbi:MAG: hypothetical protein ABEJ28_06815 [Salinigranum sp.]